MTATGGRGSAERASSKGRLRAALLLTVGVLCVEVAGGLAIGQPRAARGRRAHVRRRRRADARLGGDGARRTGPRRGRHTFGLARAEVLAAFVNAQILLVASLAILWEAWQRFHSPGPIHTGSCSGWRPWASWPTSRRSCLLHAGARRDNLDVRAAYLEVVTDALASAGACIVGAAVMARTGWFGLDALVSAGDRARHPAAAARDPARGRPHPAGGGAGGDRHPAPALGDPRDSPASRRSTTCTSGRSRPACTRRASTSGPRPRARAARSCGASSSSCARLPASITPRSRSSSRTMRIAGPRCAMPERPS